MTKGTLDEIDHQILDILIENTRTPFTDIAKKLLISAGTIHLRIKKMEELGLIMGSSLILDYGKLDHSFVAFVGILLNKTNQINSVVESLIQIPNITNVHISAGKFHLFCKLRAKNTSHAKNIIFQIDDIAGIERTETMISMEENFNDKNRLMHQIFNKF